MFASVFCRFGFAAIVVSIALALTSSAQLKPIPHSEAEMEREDDPPTFFWGRGFSPGRRSVYGGFTSYQVNVTASGQNVVGDAANEPSITVDPTNGNRMAIGWRQFNSISSNFRRAGWAYSTNGGLNWTFPGSIDAAAFRSDPVLYSDADGRFYYLSLRGDLFTTMYRSENFGQSWLDPRPATGSDKQWFVIDNTNSAGRGFHYQSFSTGGNNYGGRQFTRSTDGGQTWMEPIFILESPSWGTLDVNSDGDLFVGGVNLNTGQFWCVRSTNAKDGSVTPHFDQSTLVDMGGQIGFQQPINPVGLIGQSYLAVDRSGTSTDGNVYMLASVIPNGVSTGSDVMFTRSTDRGQTFSKPVRVNDDPVNPNKWHWMAAFSVAPNGRIDAVWLDTRNAANHTDSQLYYSYSFDGGEIWSKNVAVSEPFDPFLGYPNQAKIGDYFQIVSDNEGGNVAYPATFNGEQDIYFVRVTPERTSKTEFDYDGDRRSDVSVYRPSDGNWHLLRSTAGYTGIQFGNSTDKIAPADYDGDGKTDVSVFRPGDSNWYILESSTGTFTASYFPAPADAHVAPTDYDGDSRADVAAFIPSSGLWLIENRASNTIDQIAFGTAGDKAAIGDLDGDGKSDLAVFRPSEGAWYYRQTSTGTAFGEQFGLIGDQPVPADYDGDGKTDIAVYRPATGSWYVKNSATSTYSGYAFGTAEDIPCPGDFDGDGMADIAVFRPSTGIWYIANSSNASFTILPFGQSGDRPTHSGLNN